MKNMKKLILSLCVIFTAVLLLTAGVPVITAHTADSGYVHIEGGVFPIPTIGGAVIPYDSFRDEGTSEDGLRTNRFGYFYEMGSSFSENSYREQLKDVGFVGGQPINDSIWFWVYYHEDGRISTVDIYLAGGGAGISLYTKLPRATANIEASSGYAHTPDSVFPIPMAGGAVIPYDNFRYDGSFFETDNPWRNRVAYHFEHESLFDEQSYMGQLRDAGFVEAKAEDDIVWSFVYSHEDGRLSVVDIYFAGGGAGVIMFTR